MINNLSPGFLPNGTIDPPASPPAARSRARRGERISRAHRLIRPLSLPRRSNWL